MPETPLTGSDKLAELRRRLEEDPSSRIFLELSRELHDSGRFEDAAGVCERGLARHPGYLSARVLLGRIYFDMGRVDEAREQMEGVLSGAPDNLVARRVLAQICQEAGDTAGALDRYRALLAFTPGDAEIEARIRELEGSPEAAGPGTGAAGPAGPGPEMEVVVDVETAEEASEEAPAVDPGVLATPTLAEIYLQQGLLGKAASVYREVLKGDPDNAEAHARLAEIERRLPPPPPDPIEEARRRKIAALTAWLGAIRRSADV